MEKRRVITKLLIYGSLLFLFLPAMALAKMPLMLYTSVPLYVIKPIIREFRKRNPDIHLEGFRFLNSLIPRDSRQMPKPI